MSTEAAKWILTLLTVPIVAFISVKLFLLTVLWFQLVTPWAWIAVPIVPILLVIFFYKTIGGTRQILAWIVCILCYIYALYGFLYYPGRFRLDHFTTTETAEEYFAKHYLGSNVNVLLMDVKEAGCKCTDAWVKKKGDWKKFDHDKSYICEYISWVFTFDPLTTHRVIIYADKNNKIVRVSIIKYCDFLL